MAVLIRQAIYVEAIPPPYHTGITFHSMAYENMASKFAAQQRIANGAILCRLNDNWLKINNQIIDEMPGRRHVYKSIDSVSSEEPDEMATWLTFYIFSDRIP